MNAMLAPELRQQYIPSLRGFNPRAYPGYWNRRKEPHVYLNQIGIDTICEFIMNSFSPTYIKQQLDVPQMVIMAWIDADDERKSKYEYAFQVEADNAMYEARDILDDAPLMNEAISKASKQAEHRRHMAKGFGSKRWGSKLDVNASVAVGVSFNFDVGLLPAQKAALEGEAIRLPSANQAPPLDLNELIGPAINVVPIEIPEKQPLTGAEARAQEQTEEEYPYSCQD
jgi:hypothetical protein